MSKKILITGATGHYGGGLASRIAQSGNFENVALLVRDQSSQASLNLAANGFELRQGSYADPLSLDRAFEGIDTLFFVSASDFEGRWRQHLNVLQAAGKAGVKHIIYTSAGYKNTSAQAPLYPVMSAHIETEKWLEQSGITYTVLRHNLYAEVIPMFVGDKAALTQGKTIYFPANDGRTSFVCREDLVDAGFIILQNANQHTNQKYAFNGAANFDFAEVNAMVSEILDLPLTYVSPDLESYGATMAGYGLPAPIVAMLQQFGQGIAEGEFESDHSDLPAILGRPLTKLNDYLNQVYK